MRESHVLRYDPTNDPWAAYNEPRLLDDTPIGTLRVVTWGHAAAVAVMDAYDPTRVKRIIKRLGRGMNPLDAIPGKRTWEQEQVRDLYARRDRGVAEAEARDDADTRNDLERELGRFVRRREDGDEAVAGALGAPVQLADGSFMTFGVVRPDLKGV